MERERKVKLLPQKARDVRLNHSFLLQELPKRHSCLGLEGSFAHKRASSNKIMLLRPRMSGKADLLQPQSALASLAKFQKEVIKARFKPAVLSNIRAALKRTTSVSMISAESAVKVVNAAIRPTPYMREYVPQYKALPQRPIQPSCSSWNLKPWTPDSASRPKYSQTL